MELLQIYSSDMHILTPDLKTSPKVSEISGKIFSRFKRTWIKSYQKYLAQYHCKVSYFFFLLMALVEQIRSIKKSKHSATPGTKA